MDKIPVSKLELICLGSSFAFSGLFYYLYRQKRATVETLKAAPQLQINEKLVEFLRDTPGQHVRYAVVEGVTRPVREILYSHHQDHCPGVIQRLVLKEHKLIWNHLARSWNESERIIHQRVNTVPFDLVHPDAGGSWAVRVTSPLEASGLEFDTVYERFHQAAQGLTDLIGHYLSGEKPKGFLETEEMIRVGAALTGIGELALDSDQIVRLQPPRDGLEYFLSTVDLAGVLKQQESSVTLWKVFLALSGLAGAAVAAVVARRMYVRLGEKTEREELRRQYESMRFGQSGGEGGEETAGNAACVICLSSPRECVFLTCGHVCCCYRCSRALLNPSCPICRSPIVRVVPLYQA